MSTVKAYLKELEVGETFTGFYVLRSKELRTTRNGQPYLVLEFGDQSGRLFGNVWEDADLINEELKDGEIVKLQGSIERYQGRKQVSVKRIRAVNGEDSIDYDDFLPKTDIAPEVYLDKIYTLILSMRNDYLRELLTAFFDDDTFATKFSRAPGGKLWHHNRIGGLIEHTYSMCRIGRMLARIYPEVDRDLLLTGTILHDIGKIEEFRYDTFIDYTDRGRLVGHISLGAHWVAERAKGIEGFPSDLLDKVMHLVLSHQAEHGSPMQPSTREAFLLHFADDIDSKMDALRRIKRDMADDERWIWVNLLERHIDLGD